MKKILVIVGTVLAILVVAAIVVPVIFKEDIQKAVDKAIAENVDAHVFFDVDNFGLSFFTNFPSLTASLTDFGIAGKGVFEEDTLLQVQSFQVAINPFSLLGESISIESISLVDPEIMVLVLPDGTANYDIAKTSEEQPAEEDTTGEGASYDISINHWEIVNGNILYNDLSTNMLASVKGLNHEGNGDISEVVYDLKTETSIDGLTFIMDDESYLNGERLYADLTLNMDMEKMKYSFKENVVRLNEFGISVDGFLAMPDETISMDLKVASRDNTFKSLLSLIPAMYTEDFNDLETAGNLSFDANIKGDYNEEQEKFPAFDFNLIVENGMFHYPDLPDEVRDVNIDLSVVNKEGDLDQTTINLKQLQASLGNNPVSAEVMVQNLVNYPVKAKIDAEVNLGDVTKMFPVEGLSLGGNLSIHLKADGVYDSVKNIIPKLDGKIVLSNGMVKSEDYPVPIENLNVNTSISNPTGKMSATTINISQFSAMVDNEPVKGNLLLQNPDNWTWDLLLDGNVNLEAVSKAAGLEGLELRGKILANIESKGNYAAVENEDYQALKTSGQVTVNNLYYKDETLPEAFEISSSDLEFSPYKINVSNFSGNLGKNDFQMSGSVENYMNYIFEEKALLQGRFNFNSSYFNLNSLMTESETTTEETQDTEDIEPAVIPKNIFFTLNTSMEEVIYDNLTLNMVRGIIIAKDGVLDMKGVSFKSMEGEFNLTGQYDTSDPDKPGFDLDLSIKGLAFSEAYKNFETVRTFAPIAEKMTGRFSTDFKLSGLLSDDMSPVYSSLVGSGLLNISNAGLENSKLVQGITSLSKLDKTDEVTMKDVLLKTKVIDGKIETEPFIVKLGQFNALIQGSQSIDGALDYKVKLDVPSQFAGQVANQLTSSLGVGNAVGSDLKLNIGVGGSYNDPKYQLLGVDSDGKSVKNTVKEEAKETVEQKTEEVRKEVKKEVEKKKEETKEEVKDEIDKAKEEARKKLKKLF